jgi:hypothetical protein
MIRTHVQVGTDTEGHVLLRLSWDGEAEHTLGITWEVALEMSRQLQVMAQKSSRVHGVHPDVYEAVARTIHEGLNDEEPE